MQLCSRLRVRLRRSSLGRVVSAMVVAGGVCVALGGCGGASASGGKGTLVVYSAQHPETTAALVAAFTKQTGIKVLLKNDDEDVLTAQLEQEGSRSPADVFFTENSNWLQQLDAKGLLAGVNASTPARVPSRDNAANGKWLGCPGAKRAHLQPQPKARRLSCRPRPWTWPTRATRACWSCRRPRPTSGRSSARSSAPTGARLR
jgi:hypothetical protein